jgi:hypothetical protein
VRDRAISRRMDMRSRLAAKRRRIGDVVAITNPQEEKR